MSLIVYIRDEEYQNAKYSEQDERQFRGTTKTWKDSDRLCIYCGLRRGNHAGFECPKNMGLLPEELKILKISADEVK